MLVVSPVLRPEAESTPNKLGATHADLRSAMEEIVRERIAAGDGRLRLVEALPLIDAGMLGDDVHPNDEGHRALAAAIGPVLREMIA